MKLKITLLLSYMLFVTIIFAQPMADRHSTTMTDGWLSCATSTNPNPFRSTGHWLKIDLGDTYALQSSTLWNFNTPERINSFNSETWSLIPLQGKLIDGMKDIVIDLSFDGSTWVEWGRYTVPMATGSGMYQGVIGPNFEGKTARYVLITGLSNHGGTCYGLGEIRIQGSISTISSTDNLMSDANVSISPNPMTDDAIVSLKDFPKGDASFIISDLQGRIIMSSQISISEDVQTKSINSQSLKNGLYLVSIFTAVGTKTVKMEVLK